MPRLIRPMSGTRHTLLHLMLDGAVLLSEIMQRSGWGESTARSVLRRAEIEGMVRRTGVRSTGQVGMPPIEWGVTDYGRRCFDGDRRTTTLTEAHADVLDSLTREPMPIVELEDDTGRSKREITNAIEDLRRLGHVVTNGVRVGRIGQRPALWHITDSGRAALSEPVRVAS